LTTRGCAYSCIFCGIPEMFGRKRRQRSIPLLIDELKRNKEKFGMKHFEVIDDNFTMFPEYVKDFCRAVIKENLGVSWDCVQGVRIDRCDAETFKLMRESGCRMIGIGVESGVQNIVNNIKKGLNLKEAKQRIKEAKDAGLIVKAFFLVGSPGETFDDVMESIKFFKETKIDVPRFGMLAPYEGSELYKWVQEHAKMIEDPKDVTHGLEYGKAVRIAFETKEFPKEERQKAYEIATKESEVWMITQKFGRVIGFFSRLDFIRVLGKKIYFSSNFLKRVVWS